MEEPRLEEDIYSISGCHPADDSITNVLLMTGVYTRIMATLCTGVHLEDSVDNGCKQGNSFKSPLLVRLSTKSSTCTNIAKNDFNNRSDRSYMSIQMKEMSPCSSAECIPRRLKHDQTCIIRQSNHERSREAKLRVVRMLFVLVIEVFVCWAPLYTFQTWKTFHHEIIRQQMSSFVWSFMFVMSYMSSCVNPITYCFMNRRFRQAFVAAICRCFCCRQGGNSYYNGTSARRLTWADSQEN